MHLRHKPADAVRFSSRRPSRIQLRRAGEEDGAERAEYLNQNQARGTDDALRRRVERLLDAHPEAVDYILPAV
jgi:hypothetical protein